MSLHNIYTHSTLVAVSSPLIKLENPIEVAASEGTRMEGNNFKLKSPSRLKPLLLGRGFPSFSSSLQGQATVFEEPSKSLDHSLSSSSSTSPGSSSVLTGSCSTSTSSSTPALSCSSSIRSGFSYSTPPRSHLEPTCPNRNRKASCVEETNSRDPPPRRSTIEDDEFSFGGLRRMLPATNRKLIESDMKKNFVDNLAPPTTSGTTTQRSDLNVLAARAKWKERNKEDILMAKKQEEEKEKKLCEKWKEWQLREAEKENSRMRRSRRDELKKPERVKSEEERRKSSIPTERKGRSNPGLSATKISRAPPPILDTATGRIRSKSSVDKL